MELRQYAATLWRWLWLLLLCGAVAGGSAYVISKNLAPVYASSTTIQINPARIGVSSDYSAILSSNLIAKTYAELLLKRPVLEAVVANLGLATTPERLADQIAVTVVRDTQLIQLTVEDLSPQQAAAIANELVSVFSAQNKEQQTGRYSEAKHSLEQEMARLQLNIDVTQAALDRLAPRTAQEQAEQSRLQELLAQYRTSYATLFQSLADVRLAEVQATDTLAVVEPAKAEPVPIRPRTATNVLLAGIVGVLLAAGAALLMEYLDDTVRSSEEVSAMLGTSALASIGRIDERTVPNRLVMLGDGARSPNGEAYISLRVNLEFASVDRPAQTILVTSSGPGEGKSTTAANLALAIAQAGRRVILVDTDLRRPSLHRSFDAPNERGVTTALFAQEGSDIAQHMIARTTVRNLYLMSSGPIPPNPAELLGSQRMAALFERLKGLADVVIFDSPPLLAVADAAILARMCDATLLVVLARQTRRSALKRAGEQLAQSGAHLAGIVLNRVTGGHSGYYHYSYAPRPRKYEFWRRMRTIARGQVQDEPVAVIETAKAVAVAEQPNSHRRNGT